MAIARAPKYRCRNKIRRESPSTKMRGQGRDGPWLRQRHMAQLPEAEHSVQLRKAVIASTVGTAIEWYDFFLYGTAAGLVFGKLYFPNEEPLARATLAAFGTYFIGFVARPVGAAIFGHYGDRIGRKATLIATLLCMGIATFLVAFVPTYASIGIWGAVMLTVLRAVQGIGVGGEWGGSVLLAMEWSRTHGQRGLIASWPQFGVPCGLLSVEFGGPCFQRLGRRSVPGLGLAHTLRAFDHSRRHRAVDSPRHSRDPGVPEAPGQRTRSSRPRLPRSSRSSRRKSSCRRCCACPSRRRSTSLPPSSSPTRSAP